MTGETQPPYKVSYTGRVRSKLQDLRPIAAQKGIGTQVDTAVKRIDDCLRANPLEFGEPLHQLRHLDLVKRLAIVPPRIVYFAVKEQDHIVFVVELRPLSGYGLEEA